MVIHQEQETACCRQGLAWKLVAPELTLLVGISDGATTLENSWAAPPRVH